MRWYSSRVNLVLGSSSPRRREILKALGFDFEVRPASIDEQAVEEAVQGGPPEIALAVARAKSKAARPERGEILIAADTVVALGGVSLGKPRDEHHAFSMLASIAGKTHQVITAVVVVGADGKELARTVTTVVSMRPAKRDVLEAYIGAGESLDKAGGYGIQGAAASLVEEVRGCYLNVVGFPACAVTWLLRQQGLGAAADPVGLCVRQTLTLIGEAPHPEISTHPALLSRWPPPGAKTTSEARPRT